MGRRDRYSLSFPASTQEGGSKGSWDPRARFSEIDAGTNLLQGMIPDLSTRKPCDVQEISIITRAGTPSTAGS